MVVLYDELEDIVGDVPYNDKLDFWNGHNYQNGGNGRHLGFGKWKNGKYYLIFGTQWEGEHDVARIVDKETIIKEAIKSSSVNELSDYPELQKIYEEKYKYIVA